MVAKMGRRGTSTKLSIYRQGHAPSTAVTQTIFGWYPMVIGGEVRLTGTVGASIRTTSAVMDCFGNPMHAQPGDNVDLFDEGMIVHTRNSRYILGPKNTPL